MYAPVVRAQEQTQNQQQSQDQATTPVPAYRPPLASVLGGGDTDSGNAPQQVTPDTNSLAGAQQLTLGVPTETRRYWQPHVDVVATGDSNALGVGSQSGWATYTSILGGFDLHQSSGRSSLFLTYSGGGTISNDGNIPNSVVQEFGMTDKITWRRAALSFFDELDYLPETSFGYGLGGISLPAGAGATVGLQPGLVPGQSILTALGQRLTNSSIGELDTFLTARSSLTFVGGYSLLHGINSGLLDFGDTIFQGGYNYQMSRADTIAAFYRFNGYRFTGNEAVNDNVVQFSYARRVTGRLAFQVAAGPDIAFFQTPVSGGSGSPGGGAASSSAHAYWSLNTSLTYQRERTGLGIAYSHGVGGGSGVLAGAITDEASGNVNRQLSRTLNGTLSAGYARNKSLGVLSFAPSNQTYSYWFGGVNFSHPLSRRASVSLSYQVQYQNANTAFCAGAACGTNLVRHQVSLSLDWLSRPLAF